MKLLLLVALGIVATQAEQSQVLKDFSVGYTKFAANVYKELRKSSSGNFLVCPLSAQVVLALANYGAKGTTTQELSAGLGVPEDKEKLKEIFRELAPHLEGNDKYTLTSANKIYLRSGWNILDDFKNTAVNVFKSDIENVDFNQKEKAAAAVNKWTEEQTHGKIENIIQPTDLNEDTRAVLINAMYFHGQWKTKFDKRDTIPRTFHVNKNTDVDVDMMETTSLFNYYQSYELGAQFLQLPYEGGEVRMVFVLPFNTEGLPALEARIDEVLTAPRFQLEVVTVVIPKFKIESTIDFKQILQNMGVRQAFSDSANFSGLSDDPTKIDKIVQKSFIEVEEKGTTAAAATALVYGPMDRSAGIFPEVIPLRFIANHPFIYYLKSPAGVTFIGRYVKN